MTMRSGITKQQRREKTKPVSYVVNSKVKLDPICLSNGSLFDCNAAILSRIYENDRLRVLKRASNDKVAGIICWTPEFEKTHYY